MGPDWGSCAATIDAATAMSLPSRQASSKIVLELWELSATRRPDATT